MTAQFIEGYVLNHTNFDEKKDKSIYLKLSINHCREELESGDYNDENGKPAPIGRIYVNKDDVERYIKNTSNSGYFTVKLPQETIKGMFVDNLDKKIKYFNVAFDPSRGISSQFVGLTTRNNKYEITPSAIKELADTDEDSEIAMTNQQLSNDYRLPNAIRSR